MVWVSDPLAAVTVTLKFPVGVPVTTSKFMALDEPPPGVGFVITSGKLPALAISPGVSVIVN